MRHFVMLYANTVYIDYDTGFNNKEFLCITHTVEHNYISLVVE